MECSFLSACLFIVIALGIGQGASPSEVRGKPVKNFKRSEIIAVIRAKDQYVPPNYDEEAATNIECQIFVENFDSINEAEMDFTLTILLQLNWVDDEFTSYLPWTNDDESYVEIDSKNLEKLWVPDLFFPNEKSASYHDVLMSNKMLRIYSGGRVSFATRITLKLSCPMDLRNYPFDKQQCILEMESFSYNEGNIVLKWVNTTDEPVYVEDASLPQFQVKHIRVDEFSRAYKNSGNHSGLIVEFHLIRNIGYYLVQMYIPSILVVMLSWISFWLNVNAVPGRISLGVLTVLTMTTQSSSVNASLPRVSYTKAIDIWMATCLLFVFMALIEFAFVNVLSRKDMNKGLKFKNVFKIPRFEKEEKSTPTREALYHNSENDIKKDPDEGGQSSGESVLKTMKKLSSGPTSALYCDVGSRLLFPFLFVIFNLVYWTYFLIQLYK